MQARPLTSPETPIISLLYSVLVRGEQVVVSTTTADEHPSSRTAQEWQNEGADSLRCHDGLQAPWLIPEASPLA